MTVDRGGDRAPSTVGGRLLVACGLVWLVATVWWWLESYAPEPDYTAKEYPDYSLSGQLEFISFVASTLVMLVGCFAIPVATLICIPRLASWGRVVTFASIGLGLLALLQCAYMMSRFMNVAPF